MIVIVRPAATPHAAMEPLAGRRALARLDEEVAKPISLSLAALERDLGTLPEDDENAIPMALLSPVGAARAPGLPAPARSPRPNRRPPPQRPPRDARRQSTAIFAGFERSTFSGAGLLGEAELAVGVDEETVLPLARDAAGAAGAAADTTLSLFVDVDVGELPLGADLPAEPTTARGASAAAAPARCASPARAPPRAAPPLAAGRDSVALLSGLARACAAGAPALDDDADGAAPRPPAAARPPPAAAPPAPRPPSRLRPPSASTSYFSSATRHAPAAR
jgi:hypothetical protein